MTFIRRFTVTYEGKMFIVGPSFVVDTACSSSLLALDQALWAIRSGRCDAAIVGGTHVCLNPRVATQYMKLGMLSADGACKSFDESGQRRSGNVHRVMAVTHVQETCIRNLHRIERNSIWCKFAVQTFKHSRPNTILVTCIGVSFWYKLLVSKVSK